MMITGEDVLAALRAVQDPELGRDLVSLNMVTDVEIRDDTVRVTVNLTTPACPLQTDIEQRCRQALLSLPGVNQVEVRFTATVTAATFPSQQNLLPDVKNILAVGSVKGGVGKTTVAVILRVHDENRKGPIRVQLGSLRIVECTYIGF